MSGRRIRRKARRVAQSATAVQPQVPVTNVDKSTGGLSQVVNIDEIPELHVLKTLTLANGGSSNGEKLPQIGSIKKLIIKVDVSTVTFVGGTTPAFTTRGADEFLKTFKIVMSDPYFGKREIIGGTNALMASRSVRKSMKGSSAVVGEFIIEFPNKGLLNAMLPAGNSVEFTLDYAVATMSDIVTGNPTSFSGVTVTISAERYQKVYPPNASIEIKNRSITGLTVAEKEVDFPDSHLYKRISFLQYNTSDALADIMTKLTIDNFGRQIADYRPATFRAIGNDKWGVAPPSGVLIVEFATPMLSKELKAIATISNATDVEFYVLTEEIELLN